MTFGSVGSGFPENKVLSWTRVLRVNLLLLLICVVSINTGVGNVCLLTSLFEKKKNERNLFWFVSWVKGYISISSHLEIKNNNNKKLKKSSSKCLQDYTKRRVESSPYLWRSKWDSLRRAGGLGLRCARCHTPRFSYMNAQGHERDSLLVCVQCSDWLNPIQSFSHPPTLAYGINKTISRLRIKRKQ